MDRTPLAVEVADQYDVLVAVEARRQLRWVTALGCIGLASLVSCGPDTASLDPASFDTASLDTASVNPANDQPGSSPTTPIAGQDADAQTPPAGARTVDQEDLSAATLVAAILDECHRPLAQRMDRIKVTVTLPNQRRLLVQADLPDRARVHEGKRDLLWVNQKVYRLDDGAASEPAAENEANRARVPALLRIVDAVAFGPLYRAIHCERDGNDFVLTDQDGVKTTLQLHAKTLLPRALVYADKQTVRFDDYLRTKTTWVVKRATLAPLGTCETFFEDGGLLFSNDFFTPPGTSDRANSGEQLRMTTPGVVREHEASTPITVVGKAAQWVILAADDDWAQRHEAYAPVHAELEAQNQRIFGFPMIWKHDGQTLLGVPFRQRDSGKAFVAPPGWKTASSPKTTQLVVYPPSGNVAERIATGTAQLQRTAANRKLTMIGPIVAQPFVHLHEGAPGKSKLANCKVRMSVRIESP
ncbi:MAG: hypothetical protein ACI8UD_000500 [Planctomycetota bacterium]|jgi:hypothetical protein